MTNKTSEKATGRVTPSRRTSPTRLKAQGETIKQIPVIITEAGRSATARLSRTRTTPLPIQPLKTARTARVYISSSCDGMLECLARELWVSKRQVVVSVSVLVLCLLLWNVAIVGPGLSTRSLVFFKKLRDIQMSRFVSWRQTTQRRRTKLSVCVVHGNKEHGYFRGSS